MKKQKNTIKNGKKGVSRRSKTKYPALNKGLNLSSRKDYIEADYINGVINDKGEKVIRALTDEEKKWLNKFYEETIVTNFYHHPELKKLNKIKKNIIEDATVQELYSQLNDLKKDTNDNKRRIKEIKEIIRITKKQNEEIYIEELQNVEEEMQEYREEELLYPDKADHKEFYRQNNARNSCIFNQARISGKLKGLNTEEYDNYVSNMLKGKDLEYVPEEPYNDDLEERAEKIIEEVKEYFKKKAKP